MRLQGHKQGKVPVWLFSKQTATIWYPPWHSWEFKSVQDILGRGRHRWGSRAVQVTIAPRVSGAQSGKVCSLGPHELSKKHVSCTNLEITHNARSILLGLEIIGVICIKSFAIANLKAMSRGLRSLGRAETLDGKSSLFFSCRVKGDICHVWEWLCSFQRTLHREGWNDFYSPIKKTLTCHDLITLQQHDHTRH